MRCTKCGYISFDHLQKCRHCSTNLQKLDSLLKGTSLQAEPPFFLASLLEEPQEEVFHPQEGEEVEEEPVISDEETEEVPLSLGEDEAELSLYEEQQEAEENILESVELPEEQEAGDEEPAMALEEEEPAIALGEEEDQRETYAEMPAALSPDSEDQSEEAPPVEALADVQEEEQQEAELPLTDGDEGHVQQAAIPEEMELKDISAPGDNLTAELEEIDLNDLMASEEGALGAEGELDLGEEVDDEEVEKIFDLSDVLTEDETEGPATVETGPASTERKKMQGTEEAVAADLDVDLDLEVT
jgi:hypothetical protein